MRLLWVVVGAMTALAADPAVYQAIRTGDVRAVKAQVTSKAGLDVANDDGLTPLMYAVMAAGPEVMRVLLDAGADVNAANADGVTALHMAAYDLAKTRLLLERGAKVDAATGAGDTALMIAADRPGNVAVAALLLETGANPSAKPANGFTALLRSGVNGDLALMRLLIAKGAKVADNQELARSSAFGHCRECVEIALAQGASPNGARQMRTALQDAAGFGDLTVVKMLVEKGADVKAVDRRGYTALMRAAISYEPGAPAVVDYLLAQGADPKPKNDLGETGLSLALRFGETPIVAALRKAGAPEPPASEPLPAPLQENTVKAAVERSLPGLQKIGAPLTAAMKCTSCHHNSLPAMAAVMARERGVTIDAKLAREEYETAANLARGRRARSNLIGTSVPDINPYPVLGIAAESRTLTFPVEMMVHHISTRQEPSGRFKSQDYRPPQEYTDITFTAVAMRALQLMPLPGRAGEFRERVTRAAQWLQGQTPRDTEDHALRLLGLAWAGAKHEAAVKGLLALQRPDGGWAQLPRLQSDAYATGESLYALYVAGVPATHPAYRRGVAYLLAQQRPDGSWPVLSRSHPVQPIMDFGYPYGHHQWISASAGAWSTMALLATMPVTTTSADAARRPAPLPGRR